MKWNTTAIKIVAFPPPNASIPDATALWTSIFGVPPQTFQNIVPNPLQPQGGSVATGKISEHDGVLNVQLGRVELAISPVDEGPEVNVPGLKDTAAVLAQAVAAASKLDFQITRMGVNIEAAWPLSSPEAFMKVVVPELPIGKMSDETLDFVFQINRPATIGARPINRIVRWLSANQQIVQLMFQAGVQSAPQFVMKQTAIASFLIDVNTIPDAQASPIPTSDLPLIWQGLAAEAQALLDNGYAHFG